MLEQILLINSSLFRPEHSIPPGHHAEIRPDLTVPNPWQKYLNGSPHVPFNMLRGAL